MTWVYDRNTFRVVDAKTGALVADIEMVRNEAGENDYEATHARGALIAAAKEMRTMLHFLHGYLQADEAESVRGRIRGLLEKDKPAPVPDPVRAATSSPMPPA